MIHGSYEYGSQEGRTPDAEWIVCPQCQGHGWLLSDEQCPKCKGEGRIKEEA